MPCRKRVSTLIRVSRSFRTLARKALLDARLLLSATLLIMFAFCWLRVWIVSLFPMDRFQTIVEQFREFQRFLPVPFEQLFTYAGRIALTYDQLIVVVCIAVWAMARGSDCISGQLGRGTMEMLLAQPVSRTRLLLTHATMTALGCLLLGGASWLGIAVGIHTTHVKQTVTPPAMGPEFASLYANPLVASVTVEVPMSDQVDPRVFWPAALNLAALGFFLAGLTTMVSAPDRFRWRTLGIAATIYVLQLIMKIAGMASERLHWLLHWTFFSCYDPERFVSYAVHTPRAAWAIVRVDTQGHWLGPGPVGYDLILVGLGVLAYAIALFIFSRRDLPAPV